MVVRATFTSPGVGLRQPGARPTAPLVTGPYAPVAGWPPLPAWRRTLLVGTPFVIVGLTLRHLRAQPPLSLALALIVAGVVCQAAEQYWLWSRWDVSPFVTGTLVGTGLHTVGLSLLAVHPGKSVVDRLLGRLGPLTLMTYLIHVAFLDVLRPYRVGFDRPTWRWLFPLLVTVLSLSFAAAYYALARAIRHYSRHGFLRVDHRLE